MTTFDLDDFSILNHQLVQLDALRTIHPDLKVTLFTVPCPNNIREFPGAMPSAGVTAAWLRHVLALRPWIQCALHGWHHTQLECRTWTKARTLEALRWAEESGLFVRGFKAPYWEMSAGVYEALLERDWWVADHERNRPMRPAGIRCYELGRPDQVHGHVQDIGTNGLQEAWPTYVAMQGPFRFIDEEMF